MDEKHFCDEHSGMCRSIKAETEKADIRFLMIETAVKVAKNEMDRRLEAMNEFRAQLDKQAAQFMPRKEIEILTIRNSDKIRDLEVSMGKISGASKWSDHLVQVIIGLAVIISVWLITKG